MRRDKGTIPIIVLVCIALGPIALGQSPREKSSEKPPSTWELVKKSQVKKTESPEPASIERILHFPKERSFGRVMIQDSNTKRHIGTFYYWIDGSDWEYFGNAQGDIKIPKGKIIRLILNSWTWQNPQTLSTLKQLHPNDIYSLTLSPTWSYSEGKSPSDECMPYVAHLRGLRILNLTYAGITSRGLKFIAELKSLERLHAPGRLTNEGLAEIVHLSTLKALYIKNHHNLTNAGLAHLAKLPSLEQLDLVGIGRVNNAGLMHLAKIPSLQYLMLTGKNFTDAGMAQLKNIPKLRILHAGHLPQLTDRALVYLAQIKTLESLSLHWAEAITDDGVVHLTKLPSLKKLDIRNSKVTDKGLLYLKDIKTLDYLSLPNQGISDIGLAYIGELRNLKNLDVSRMHYVDPKEDKGYYTDKGVAELANCKLLEELNIGSLGLTDEGMTHIASLTNLKQLSLFGCSNVTNNGMAKLKNLKSLKNLFVSSADMTIGGLSFLNELPNLTDLTLVHIRQDGSIMDISASTELEDIIFTLHRRRNGDLLVSDPFKNEDWACLANLKKLKRLQITGVGIDDDGVKYLSGLTNLEYLNIYCQGESKITDQALKYLKNMHKLNRLYIKDGHFTDRALDYLDGMSSLTWLELTSDYALSNQAIRDFRQKNPNITKLQLMP